MRIFESRMKKAFIIIVYWLSAIFLTAFLLMSLDYYFWAAVLMSLSFLTAALALSFLLPKVDSAQSGKKRAFDTVCIILGVMMMNFLLIYLWQLVFIAFIYPEESAMWKLPAMLGNPVFVAAVLAILAYGNYLLMKWLDKKFPSEHPITFTSDYKKVSMKRGYPVRGIPRFRGLDHSPRRPAVSQQDRNRPVGKHTRSGLPSHP